MTSGLSLELPEVATMQISGRSHFQAEKIALKGEYLQHFPESEMVRAAAHSARGRIGGRQAGGRAGDSCRGLCRLECGPP